MDEKIKNIYNYVRCLENFNYSKLTGGENIATDIIASTRAGAYQNVRYYIENMLEHEEDKT